MANLKLNPSKCKIFCHEVRYLGHITAKGVQTDPEKISEVENCCSFERLDQLRNFLGLSVYCRKFVKGFFNYSQTTA